MYDSQEDEPRWFRVKVERRIIFEVDVFADHSDHASILAEEEASKLKESEGELLENVVYDYEFLEEELDYDPREEI
jgi:hypothetical protein